MSEQTEHEGLPEPSAWVHRQGNYTEAAERQLNDDEISRGWTQEALFTTAQMRAYATAAVLAEREAMLRRIDNDRWNPGRSAEYREGYFQGVKDCEDAIRGDAEQAAAVELPEHLREDAPAKLRCDACGRKSWDSAEYCAPCRMPQPNGSVCQGVMRGL